MKEIEEKKSLLIENQEQIKKLSTNIEKLEKQHVLKRNVNRTSLQEHDRIESSSVFNFNENSNGN